MPTTYQLYAIPLDGADPRTATTAFETKIVSNLQFVDGPLTQAGIDAVLAAHPILGRGPAPALGGLMLPYDAWRQNGRALNNGTPGVVRVNLTFAGTKPLGGLLSSLKDYLRRPDGIGVSRLGHDHRFDDLGQDRFLEITRTHDDLAALRAELYDQASARLGFAEAMSPHAFSPETFSYDQARWLNSYVQAQLLDEIFVRPGRRALALKPAANAALDRVRAAISKVQRRMATSPTARVQHQTRLQTTTQSGPPVDVSSNDPNVALHAALKNGVIAEACGIVTTWRVQSPVAVAGDYVLALDLANLATPTASVVTQPTAFRRGTHTHPVCFADAGKALATSNGQPLTTNSGLAYLNDVNGAPRYRATTINAEVSFVQNTILQQGNSISNSPPPPRGAAAGNATPKRRDDRPPQLLRDEQFGTNELESTGLTISAPVDDLVTPQALKDQPGQPRLPCLFLDDLWVGFRLDLADAAGRALLSVHRQKQEVTFRASGVKVSGEMEDFYAREQADPTKDVTSTEIGRYTGMTSAQLQDYMRFLGTYEEPQLPVEPPFTARVTGYSDATRLTFGKLLRYRLRTVFLGGVSLSDRDPNLDRLGPNYVQTCPFFRARAFHPGEIVSTDSDSAIAGGMQTIFLTDSRPKANVWVVPTPVDPDTARYHGIFMAQTDEPDRSPYRAFVKDITKFFKERGIKYPYFVDPDVNELVVRVTMLNGDPKAVDHEFAYTNGSYCELVQHLRLDPVRMWFGNEGQWERFQPIKVECVASADGQPRVQSSQGLIRVRVPPAADIEISLVPALTSGKLLQSASYASSTAQFADRQARGLKDTSWAPVPGLVEHKIRVLHCLRKPTASPVIVSDPAFVATRDQQVVLAQREKYKDTAELRGYVQLDAASTGQVRLEASWSDIDDNPQYPKYSTNAGSNASAPRSVTFEKQLAPPAARVARAADAAVSSFVRVGPQSLSAMFGLQCAENKVFLGAAAPGGVAPQSGRPCVLNFGDARRKRAAVTVVATSRHKNQFSPAAAADFETRSDKLMIEVPASMRLPAPDVSHVVPLARDIVLEGANRRQARRAYAMRIYVRRPWFLSGPGERLAVGCRVGQPGVVPRSMLDKYVTQWGEDPVERAKLETTLRSPRASDFKMPSGAPSPQLDGVLYPARSIEGTSPLIYADNIVRTDTDAENASISVASYALRWDSEANLWYCDVEVTEGFTGWCGMALYRHQPHAHDGSQVSDAPAWVYGAVLHGEQVAWTKQNGQLHVTIGPIFDRYMSFELDPRPFRRGISTNLQAPGGQRVTLRSYTVGGGRFFEGLVSLGRDEWSLMKRRFDTDVGSISL